MQTPGGPPPPLLHTDQQASCSVASNQTCYVVSMSGPPECDLHVVISVPGTSSNAATAGRANCDWRPAVGTWRCSKLVPHMPVYICPMSGVWKSQPQLAKSYKSGITALLYSRHHELHELNIKAVGRLTVLYACHQGPRPKASTVRIPTTASMATRPL